MGTDKTAHIQAPAQGVQSAPPGTTPWTIDSQPLSAAESEDVYLHSMSNSTLQYGNQQLQLSITPSSNWTPGDVTRLSTLLQGRNRYVCMQLVTMVKEQYAKVAAAEAAADVATLQSARFMFLATVTLTDTNAVVAAGIFYPRMCSKDNIEMPHMYVELLCCNHPGRGYGTILLQHIEQFTAGCCDQLSAGFFGFTGHACLDQDNTCSSSTQDICIAAASAATAQDLRISTSLQLVAMGVTVPAGGAAGVCCTACSSECSMTDTTTVVALRDYSKGPQVETITTVAGGINDLASTASRVSAATISHDRDSGCHECLLLIPEMMSAAAQCASPASTVFSSCNSSISPCIKLNNTLQSSPTKRIQGIKLLSVAAAQPFYERNGYGAPDVCKEMFKPLTCCCKRACGLCDTDSVASSSCSSIAMSLG